MSTRMPILLALFLQFSCQSGAISNQGGTSGGGTLGATGGQAASGGMNATGGQSSTGGETSTGGEAATGGANSTGGQGSTGGETSTGGEAATGGQTDTGGDTETGGTVLTGGQSSTGGQGSTGGQVATEWTEPEAGSIAVAVGYGAKRAWSPDGETWMDLQELDANGRDDENLFRGLGYGDGVWMAVGGAQNGFSMTSRDGKTWQNTNRDARAFLSNVVWVDGQWIAAGGNGLRTRSTDGGLTWTNATGFLNGHFRDIAGGNGVAVAVGHSYGRTPNVGLIATTRNGVDWTLTEGGAIFGRIAFGNGVFVAVGDEGRVIVSSDGESWTESTLDVTSRDDKVEFAKGEFLILTDTGYLRSKDGSQWQVFTTSARRPIKGYLNNHYISLGWPSSIDISEDLTSWQNVFAPDGSGFSAVQVGLPGAP